MKRLPDTRGVISFQEHVEEDNTTQSRLKKQRVKERILQRQGMKHLNVINQHPRDLEITFVEQGHYYHDQNGIRFRLSVSGFKGLFLPTFNMSTAIESKFQNAEFSKTKKEMVVGKSQIAKYLPEDYGLTRKECLEKMRNKAKFGTIMHDKIEKYIILQGEDSFVDAPDEFRLVQILGVEYSDEQLCCAQQVIQAENEYSKQGWKPEKVEWSIFSRALDVAGQIDLLLSRKTATGEKEYMVLDWKTTDKDIRKPSANWRIKFLPFPNNHLPNCLDTEYSLQESLYSWILLKEYGMKVVEIRTVVLNPYKSLPVVVSKPPLIKEVDKMADIWQNYRQLEKIILKWESGEESSDLLPRIVRPIYYNKSV
jgi:hypothetical protein